MSSRVSPLGFWGLGSLDPIWPLVKVRSLLASLDLTWSPVKPEPSSGLLRTSLASSRSAGDVLSTGVDYV